MNIFYISSNPVKCAKVLDDLRLNKMIIETAQLLSTTVHMISYDKDKNITARVYKATHINHPCAKWCRDSRTSFIWLFRYFICLNKEYYKRKNKLHKSYNLVIWFEEFLKTGPIFYYNTGVILPPQCNPLKDKYPVEINKSNLEISYKETLLYKWRNDKREPTWSGIKLNESQRYKLLYD
jgi:hypothetical protein